MFDKVVANIYRRCCQNQTFELVAATLLDPLCSSDAPHHVSSQWAKERGMGTIHPPKRARDQRAIFILCKPLLYTLGFCLCKFIQRSGLNT